MTRKHTTPRKPPRTKHYRPRPVATNTLVLALHRAAKPSKADIDEVLQPIHQAHKSMREGVVTAQQFGLLAGCLDVAVAIEHLGVVRGLRGHLDAADVALQKIYARSDLDDGWKPTALYWDELDALQTFVDLHVYQINQLSRGEYIAACNRAAGQNRSAGLRVTFVSDIPAMQAESAP